MACEYLPTQTVTLNQHVGVSGQGRAAEARLISALHGAYRQGSQKSAGSATAEVYKFLGDLWLARVKDRLNQPEQSIAAKCRRYCADGHRAALDRNITRAGELLEAARVVLKHDAVNRELRLLCEAQQSAAQAYLDYCCGRFLTARNELFQSLNANQILEDEFGYRFLHGQRLHLLNNLVKLEMRSRRLPQAMHLAASTYLYVTGNASAPLIPGSWGWSYVAELPVEVLRFISAQLTMNICEGLFDLHADAAWNYLRVVVESAAFAQPHSAWDPTARAWFELKKLWLSNEDLPAYLSRCILFFSAGPGIAPGLWYATALDAAAACDHFPQTESCQFRQQVANDISNAKFLPTNFRAATNRLQNPKLSKKENTNVGRYEARSPDVNPRSA